jgi:hypothetical protein
LVIEPVLLKISIAPECLNEYVSKLGILSVKEWQTYTKINRPENIPTNPQRTYRDNGCKGWADFLGKEK